jgi:hypothetical protein
LGVLLEIRGDADFRQSQVEDLGNLQTIGGNADFSDSQLEGLGDLHTIEGSAEFRNSEIRYFRRLRTIGGNANFEDSQVEDLGTLQEIGGNADFADSQVESLGNLQEIGGNAYFVDSQVQDLGDLRIIGGSADFANSQVQSLGKLRVIGGQIYFGDKTNLQDEWEMRQTDLSDMTYAKGGGVGGFSSKEYDKPRGKTIYDVEVEDEDDDKIILEKYDNYDEAISAYARSKYRFPITWRTYLETQKAPFVYEGGIVLTDGTLAVKYRKGKDVKHDFNGNEIYAKGGGVYTSDKIFVLEVRDGETNELLEEKVYRANRYSTALLDAEYDEDLFKKKYGDYLHFKLKEKYAKGGGVGGANSTKTINVLEKNYVLNSDIKNFKVEYEIGVFPSGKKDSNNLSITRYSDELGGSQKSVLKILSKSEAKRIFNQINKSNVKDFFQMLEKKS